MNEKGLQKCEKNRPNISEQKANAFKLYKKLKLFTQKQLCCKWKI